MVPTLRPAQLHRVIAAYGLADCADLLAQASPAQLSELFDLDLWRPAGPGLDEQFDAERFGLWIEVLAEAGADVAAAKVAAMPLAQIVAGLAHHVRVFDVAAVSSYETTDGTQIDYSRPVRHLTDCEIGGYRVAATRDGSWGAIVEVLVSLDTHHPDRFVELMRAVRSRSHSLREADGFHSLLQNREQMMFDVASERERRRAARGFASPAEARAFLELSRSVTADGAIAGPDRRPVEALERLAQKTSRIQLQMRIAFERDQAAYGERHVELAYLANILMSGCPVQARPFAPKEAADAAVAVCNLGLEIQADLPADYLVTHDLIAPFQAGWKALYEDVCLYAANSLASVLAGLRVGDDANQAALNLLRVRLRREIERGTPWRTRDGLDALAILDIPAMTALAGLIAECPVIHAALPALLDRGVRAIDPDAFEFISEPAQLATVRRFITALPAILCSPYATDSGYGSKSRL